MVGPRVVDKPLVLYGNGKLGRLAREIFHELNIPIIGLVDKTCAFPQNHPKDSLLAICVATEPYQSIVKPLQEAGWKDIVPVWDIIEAYPEVRLHNGWFTGGTTSERPEISFVNKNLDTFTSKEQYMLFRLWRQHRAELTPFTPIEIASNPLPSTLADIRSRQREHIHPSCEKDVTIHSEGMELAELELNIDTFKQSRPKLSVACYHSRDGLWKIEKFLMDHLPDYQWTFRLTAYMGQGAYIMGCPKEGL